MCVHSFGGDTRLQHTGAINIQPRSSVRPNSSAVYTLRNTFVRAMRRFDKYCMLQNEGAIMFYNNSMLLSLESMLVPKSLS